MPTEQGSLALLDDPVAQRLLQSTIPARFAYTWTDGTPRVVPIVFHWNGQEIVLGTPPDAPKMKALHDGDKVALSIDSDSMPYKVLLIRGGIRTDVVDGISPEYEAATVRNLGAGRRTRMAREPASDVSPNGPHFCDAGVGRHPRFRDPLPECHRARRRGRPGWGRGRLVHPGAADVLGLLEGVEHLLEGGVRRQCGAMTRGDVASCAAPHFAPKKIPAGISAVKMYCPLVTTCCQIGVLM